MPITAVPHTVQTHELYQGSEIQFRADHRILEGHHILDYISAKERCDDLTAREKSFLRELSRWFKTIEEA